MRKAMITIEVLISLLILFIVVATSVTALKNTAIVENKKDKYQDYYRTLLNTQAMISDTLCIKKSTIRGSMNGFGFYAKCSKVSELQSYRKAFERNDPEGNIGPVRYTLYQVTLTLQKKYIQKTYQYYKTIAQKI